MKLSLFVSLASWVSVFVLAWLVLLDYLPTNNLSEAMFGFFLFLAILSGMQSLPKKPDDTQKM